LISLKRFVSHGHVGQIIPVAVGLTQPERHFSAGRLFSRLSVSTGADRVCGNDADCIDQRQQKYNGDEYKGREKAFIHALGAKRKVDRIYKCQDID
jgi:hypothetical protein